MNKTDLLNADEMAAFNRFCECCEDFDSGGYDVEKAMMLQLARIGVVRSTGFGRYETTKVGDIVRARRTPADAVGAGELPPLPKHEGPIDTYHDNGTITSQDGYTAEQMQQFGREAIAYHLSKRTQE
jgi:hypothetical protein